MKTKNWVVGIVFAILSVATFYISFVVQKKPLIVAILGLLAVLLIGLLFLMLIQWTSKKSIGLLWQTIIVLISVNLGFFVTFFTIFSDSLAHYLTFAMTYTVIYSGFEFMRYKLRSD